MDQNLPSDQAPASKNHSSGTSNAAGSFTAKFSFNKLK